ncbi:DUF1990 family protein [Deinococcus ruber]|uniref:DUF1990 domain-containing protein n=1 Tax=Deinococcus ruber TaxID=1848197 RepID=A0A918CIL7_9DEIO|nr:DUF1990 domain-containing protein [Deinococcus ruber]GGR24870.1 hypothetical protein GCM10008957_40660 [Deinococcus ruber]
MRLSRGSLAKLEREVERLQHLPATYRPIGVTLKPGEKQQKQYIVGLGSGENTFQQARTALRGWQTHRSHWLQLYPASSPPTEQQTVLVLLKAAGLCLSFGCRVVQVIDEARRYGFAYGTLPGHPERGEELFLIEWQPDDRVNFTLSAVSRPANLLYALGRPFGLFMRQLGTRQYLNAMQRATERIR